MFTSVASVCKGRSQLGSKYAIPVLACGHAAEMEYHDRAADRHAPTNWRINVGDPFDCQACDRTAAALAVILAFVKTADYSHTTRRDLTASQTGDPGWQSFCVYRRDPSSPTGCCLEISVEATPTTEAALRAAGITYTRGPSRGAMAKG